MKVKITHLKAPWPSGAKPGDVVELQGDTLPGWALGKCTPASDDEALAFEAMQAEAKAAQESAAAQAEEDALIAATLAEADKQHAEEAAAAEAKAAQKAAKKA